MKKLKKSRGSLQIYSDTNSDMPKSKRDLAKLKRKKQNLEYLKRLKTAVTGRVKKGSKAAKRRKNFCARSRSWTGERGKATRRRWRC